MVFSRLHIIIYTYAELVKLGQTGALPGPTEVAPTFSGINGASPEQTMPIPVRTCANHDATVLHWGYTRLTPGQTGQRARFITVETRTLQESSWLTTVFVSPPVDSRLLSTSQSNQGMRGSTLFIHVRKGCPLL